MSRYQKVLIALFLFAIAAFSLPYILLKNDTKPAAAAVSSQSAPAAVSSPSSSLSSSSQATSSSSDMSKPAASEVVKQTTTSEVTYTPSQPASSNSGYTTSTHSSDTKTDSGSSTNPNALTVTVEIDGADIFSSSGTVEINKNDTVYQATSKYLNAKGMSFKSTGGSMAYVSAINNLKEKQYGPMSGWMFNVDGKEPTVGCGQYKLNGGETITWKYQKNE